MKQVTSGFNVLRISFFYVHIFFSFSPFVVLLIRFRLFNFLSNPFEIEGT